MPSPPSIYPFVADVISRIRKEFRPPPPCSPHLAGKADAEWLRAVKRTIFNVVNAHLRQVLPSRFSSKQIQVSSNIIVRAAFIFLDVRVFHALLCHSHILLIPDSPLPHRIFDVNIDEPCLTLDRYATWRSSDALANRAFELYSYYPRNDIYSYQLSRSGRAWVLTFIIHATALLTELLTESIHYSAFRPMQDCFVKALRNVNKMKDTTSVHRAIESERFSGALPRFRAEIWEPFFSDVDMAVQEIVAQSQQDASSAMITLVTQPDGIFKRVLNINGLVNHDQLQTCFTSSASPDVLFSVAFADSVFKLLEMLIQSDSESLRPPDFLSSELISEVQNLIHTLKDNIVDTMFDASDRFGSIRFQPTWEEAVDKVLRQRYPSFQREKFLNTSRSSSGVPNPPTPTSSDQRPEITSPTGIVLQECPERDSRCRASDQPSDGGSTFVSKCESQGSHDVNGCGPKGSHAIVGAKHVHNEMTSTAPNSQLSCVKAPPGDHGLQCSSSSPNRPLSTSVQVKQVNYACVSSPKIAASHINGVEPSDFDIRPTSKSTSICVQLEKLHVAPLCPTEEERILVSMPHRSASTDKNVNCQEGLQVLPSQTETVHDANITAADYKTLLFQNENTLSHGCLETDSITNTEKISLGGVKASIKAPRVQTTGEIVPQRDRVFDRDAWSKAVEDGSDILTKDANDHALKESFPDMILESEITLPGDILKSCSSEHERKPVPNVLDISGSEYGSSRNEAVDPFQSVSNDRAGEMLDSDVEIEFSFHCATPEKVIQKPENAGSRNYGGSETNRLEPASGKRKRTISKPENSPIVCLDSDHPCPNPSKVTTLVVSKSALRGASSNRAQNLSSEEQVVTKRARTSDDHVIKKLGNISEREKSLSEREELLKQRELSVRQREIEWRLREINEEEAKIFLEIQTLRSQLREKQARRKTIQKERSSVKEELDALQRHAQVSHNLLQFEGCLQ